MKEDSSNADQEETAIAKMERLLWTPQEDAEFGLEALQICLRIKFAKLQQGRIRRGQSGQLPMGPHKKGPPQTLIIPFEYHCALLYTQ